MVFGSSKEVLNMDIAWYIVYMYIYIYIVYIVYIYIVYI